MSITVYNTRRNYTRSFHCQNNSLNRERFGFLLCFSGVGVDSSEPFLFFSYCLDSHLSPDTKVRTEIFLNLRQPEYSCKYKCNTVLLCPTLSLSEPKLRVETVNRQRRSRGVRNHRNNHLPLWRQIQGPHKSPFYSYTHCESV